MGARLLSTSTGLLSASMLEASGFIKPSHFQFGDALFLGFHICASHADLQDTGSFLLQIWALLPLEPDEVEELMADPAGKSCG